MDQLATSKNRNNNGSRKSIHFHSVFPLHHDDRDAHPGVPNMISVPIIMMKRENNNSSNKMKTRVKLTTMVDRHPMRRIISIQDEDDDTLYARATPRDEP
jgi:hypothetical protein